MDDPEAKPYFIEHYDIATDPWQLNNTAVALSAHEHQRLSQRLEVLRHCKGVGQCE